MSMSDKRFDRLLWEMAHREEVPIPPGLDERLEKLYLRLEQAESEKDGQPGRRKMFTTARVAALAAVLALCLASMALGALAFSTERVTEVEVEVPVEQEVIVLEDIGISLILPDGWRDRYVITPQKSGSGCHVYVKMIYDWCVDVGEIDPELGELDPGFGHLFSVTHCSDTPMTPEEFYGWMGHTSTYLLSTEDGTYCAGYPSDVQYPLEPIYPPRVAEQTTPEQVAAMAEEYLAMEQEIADIQIVLNHIQAGTLEQSDRMNSNEAARRWHASAN